MLHAPFSSLGPQGSGPFVPKMGTLLSTTKFFCCPSQSLLCVTNFAVHHKVTYRKRLQNLDIKHVLHAPKDFSLNSKFLIYKKIGRSGQKRKKNIFFSKMKKGFKNWILNMCHMPPQKIFKISKNFKFFSKRGIKESTN